MAVSERDRHRFYEIARATLGELEADCLMEMLSPEQKGGRPHEHR